jgi:hypothetical protein
MPLHQIANELYIAAVGGFGGTGEQQPAYNYNDKSRYLVVLAMLFLAAGFFIPETARRQ